MPELSIIVPHYRAFDRIGRLLSSIPEEEWIELIVVDDWSGEAEAVCRLRETVRRRGGVFLENPGPGKGAGVARNMGLDAARGKWVLFADSDDFFTDGAFACFAAHLSSAADIVYFSPTSVMEGTEQAADRHLRYARLVQDYVRSSSHRNELQLRYKTYGPCFRMIRRGLIERHAVRFDTIRVSEDVMFSVRSGFFARSIEAFPDVVYCITTSASSLSRSQDEAAFLVSADADARYCRFLLEHLSKKDYRSLSQGGWKFTRMALRQGFGLHTAAKVLRIMRRERVPFGLLNALRVRAVSGNGRR